MKRQIIKIDEEKCNGCGVCVPNCHEGALQVIDGKVRLISDLFCDGLGACIGHCPEGAIEIEEREAAPYNEKKVMELMVPKGRNTILAHLEHLRDHNEQQFLAEAIQYLKENNIDMSVKEDKVKGTESFPNLAVPRVETQGNACGCPGAATMDFRIDEQLVENAVKTIPGDPLNVPSELRQWPVQLHLLNPQASYFQHADVVLAADCVAFAMGNFHARFLKGKSVAIACPKLDTNKESYLQKLTSMITDSKINSLTVAIMEVPCCGGLLQMAKVAKENSGSNITIKLAIVNVQGEILEEKWV
jgi:NAD-dependent dihydropyrimidine dehydrogenase PreA subunit